MVGGCGGFSVKELVEYKSSHEMVSLISGIHHQKYMREDSTFAHSRSVRGSGPPSAPAHHLSGDTIRAAETAQMLPHTKLMVN